MRSDKYIWDWEIYDLNIEDYRLELKLSNIKKGVINNVFKKSLSTLLKKGIASPVDDEDLKKLDKMKFKLMIQEKYYRLLKLSIEKTINQISREVRQKDKIQLITSDINKAGHMTAWNFNISLPIWCWSAGQYLLKAPSSSEV